MTAAQLLQGPMREARRILVVTDFSAGGDLAIAAAFRMSRTTGAAVAITHAVPHVDAIRPLFPHRLVDDALVGAELPRRAEAELRARLTAMAISEPFELFVREGNVLDVTTAVVDAWKPELVVVGSPIDDAIGTVGIVRSVTVPVLIARASPATRRVVVGTDFSDPALPAIHAAASAAATLGGELVLAHAIEVNPLALYGGIAPLVMTDMIGELRSAARQRLVDIAASLAPANPPPTIEVVLGPSASSLIDLATRTEAELLVVASHGRTGLTRLLLGSVAEALIHRAPCSVLVTRLAG